MEAVNFVLNAAEVYPLLFVQDAVPATPKTVVPVQISLLTGA